MSHCGLSANGRKCLQSIGWKQEQELAKNIKWIPAKKIFSFNSTTSAPHKLLWSLMDSENITYIKFFIKPSINALLHTSTTQYQP